MTGRHTSWRTLRDERLAGSAPGEAYYQARASFLLSGRVRAAREAAGISQAELAARIGSTPRTIARLEAGAFDGS